MSFKTDIQELNKKAFKENMNIMEYEQEKQSIFKKYKKVMNTKNIIAAAKVDTEMDNVMFEGF